MKATQRDFASVAIKAAASARVFFFCGPDEAGAQDGAERILSLLGDLGEKVELAGADLRRDPARLGDEARSVSLFGDKRHIVVRAQGDEAHDALAILIEAQEECCPVLVIATSASDKSRSAKLLEGKANALVAMFHPPDLRNVAGAVRQLADGMGVSLSTELAERVARSSGLDSRIARSELTKLALYLDASPQGPRKAEAKDLDAIGASTEDDGFNAVINAVLGGQAARIPAELARVREQGMNPVGVALALERRVVQLGQLAARLGNGRNVREFIEAEASARRVFWKDKGDLERQLSRWRGKRLVRLVERVVALHGDLIANGQNGHLLLARELTEIGRAAVKTA